MLLGFFGLRVMEIDARTDGISKIVEADAARHVSDRTDTYSGTSPTIYSPTIEDMRWAIREELAAIEGLSTAQENRSSSRGELGGRANAGPEARPGGASSVDHIYLKDSVSKDVDNYIGFGKIAPAEMATLQMKIARLPPQDRREILSRLTKAMNAGDLEGEF